MFINKEAFLSQNTYYDGNMIELVEICNEAEISVLNLVQGMMINESLSIRKNDNKILLEAEQGFFANLWEKIKGFFGKIGEWISSFLGKAQSLTEKIRSMVTEPVKWALNNPGKVLAGAALLWASGEFTVKMYKLAFDEIYKRQQLVQSFLNEYTYKIANKQEFKESDPTPNTHVTKDTKIPEGMSFVEASNNFIINGDPTKKAEPEVVDESWFKSIKDKFFAWMSKPETVEKEANTWTSKIKGTLAKLENFFKANTVDNKETDENKKGILQKFKDSVVAIKGFAQSGWATTKFVIFNIKQIVNIINEVRKMKV